MKKENTSIRLKKIMADRNLRQIDILNMTIPYCKKYDVKMNKSDISQYCSGKTEPNQDKLFILGEALNVNEAWLMGFDTPMERNNEDQNIIRFDAELEEAWNIIEKAGYSLSFLSPPNDTVMTITDKNGNIVVCMHDYELVNKYESLRKKEHFSLTAESLLFTDKKSQYIIDKVYAFDCQLRALGWSYKIITEPNPNSSDHAITYALFKNKDISFRVSGDDYNFFIDDSENFYKDRLQQLLKKSMNQVFDESYPLPVAAHARTDIDVTEEMIKHDDDIMDDDDF